MRIKIDHFGYVVGIKCQLGLGGCAPAAAPPLRLNRARAGLSQGSRRALAGSCRLSQALAVFSHGNQGLAINYELLKKGGLLIANFAKMLVFSAAELVN